MALALLINPLTENKSLDFSEAWYALDVGSLSHLQMETLRLLNAGATKHFWVSFRVG